MAGLVTNSPHFQEPQEPDENKPPPEKGSIAELFARMRPLEVKFFVKNRWIESGALRVKAMAAGGAAAIGIRQAKRDHLKPRTRVVQTVVKVVPVRGGER